MAQAKISDIMYHLQECMKEQGNIDFKINLETKDQSKYIEVRSVSYENGVFQINCDMED